VSLQRRSALGKSRNDELLAQLDNIGETERLALPLELWADRGPLGRGAHWTLLTPDMGRHA
jgi:hypothetical protein